MPDPYQGAVAYAEQKLADAQHEVVCAQQHLQRVREQAQYELDQQGEKLASTAAMIAEFDGKLYVSLKRARFGTERHDQDLVDRITTTGRTAELRCECGKSTRWDISLAMDVIAYQYIDNDGAGQAARRLIIVRTPLNAPFCEDWLQLPLKLDANA